MDAAVIDRIRLLHDEGMPPSRIASTMGVPEPDVLRALPAGGLYVGLSTKPVGVTATVGPLVDLPVSYESKGTAKQREIWALVHDEGLTRVEAAARLGSKAPTIRNQLIAYMKVNGLTGPLPGASGRTGPLPRKAANNMTAPPDVVIHSTVIVGETVTTTGEPTTNVNGSLRIVVSEQVPAEHADAPETAPPSSDRQVEHVVIPGADHAKTIPPAIPDDPAPVVAVSSRDQGVPSPDLHEGFSSSDIAPDVETDLLYRYVEALLAHESDGYAIRDRIERALGVNADDRDLWTEGYRRALGDILAAVDGVSSGDWRYILVARIARLAIEVPQA